MWSRQGIELGTSRSEGRALTNSAILAPFRSLSIFLVIWLVKFVGYQFVHLIAGSFQKIPIQPSFINIIKMVISGIIQLQVGIQFIFFIILNLLETYITTRKYKIKINEIVSISGTVVSSTRTRSNSF